MNNRHPELWQGKARFRKLEARTTVILLPGDIVLRDAKRVYPEWYTGGDKDYRKRTKK